MDTFDEFRTILAIIRLQRWQQLRGFFFLSLRSLNRMHVEFDAYREDEQDNNVIMGYNRAVRSLGRIRVRDPETRASIESLTSRGTLRARACLLDENTRGRGKLLLVEHTRREVRNPSRESASCSFSPDTPANCLARCGIGG